MVTTDTTADMTVYVKTIPPSNANPHDDGYYELVDGSYVLSSDTSIPMEFVAVDDPQTDRTPAEIGYYELNPDYDPGPPPVGDQYILTQDEYLIIGKTYYAERPVQKDYYRPELSSKQYYAKTDEDLELTDAQYQSALDGSRIVASSITANELNVENITATGNAFMNNLQTRLLEANQVRVGPNNLMHILISPDPEDPKRVELGFYNGNDELYLPVKPEEGSDPRGYYVIRTVDGKERFVLAENVSDIAKDYVSVTDLSAESNPSALRLYEYDSVEGEYVLTEDTAPVSGKDYYEYRQVVVYEYVAVASVLDENDPSVLGYYEEDGNGGYQLTQDTSPVDGKTYYDHRPVPNYYEFHRNYDARVAYIDGYKLMIPYSVVLNQMILGEWAWTYRSNGNMDLVYIGTEE